jgi:tRNA(fMet)-specific endonuclease VapC
MAYLVDSDWVIDYLAGSLEALELLDRLADDGVAISIVTYMEVFQGVERSDDPQGAERQLSAFLQSVPLLPMSPAVARRCARLRETLRRQGKRVHNRALDLLIAATAIEHELTLVTRNLQDYTDITDITDLTTFAG